MAAQDYTSVVQQLYVSYFGRPADYYGLQNFSAALDKMGAPKDFAAVQAAVQADKAGTTALSQLVNSFNASAESVALYGNDNSQIGIGKFVNAIYQNVLGRSADKAGFDFWVNAITTGELTKANAAAAITQAALTNTTDQGKIDALTVQNKLAVATSFTTALDTPAEITAFSGDAAAAASRGLLANVNNGTDLAAYQATVTGTIDNIVALATPGQTFALTSGIDNLMGTAGNDVFNIVVTADANPIGSLDVIEGGLGRDVLNVADTSAGPLSLTGLTIKNVETLVASSATALNLDISGTGVTNATLSSAAIAGTDTVTAADTTNVTLTAATGAATQVNGGKAVVVNGSGANGVTGSGLTSVTVNGGTATVSNNTASTLTTVTLKGVSGANSLTGKGLTTVNLNNITAASTVTVSNSTADHALTVNADGVGYNSSGAAVAVSVTDSAAKTVAINAVSKTALAVNAAAATSATVGGAGAAALNLTGSTALTSLDASGNTGGVTLTGVAASVVTIKGSAGADSFTTAQTAKVAFDLGAGNDVVTLGSAIAAGSTINLGAGNDKLVVGTGGSIAANTSSASTVIDGGDGIDTLAAGLINAGNAAQFKNFETLGLDASTLDVALATSNTFTGLELLAGGGTYTNISAAQALAVNTNTSGFTTLTFKDVGGAADAYTITFGANTSGTSGSPTAINAGVVSIAGVENINVVSKAAAGVAANSIILADSAAQTVTVTGDQALSLSFSAGFGSVAGKGVSMIDASAATAAVTINTMFVNAASGGLTVKGGTAGDSISLHGAATVDAGAGDDTIVVAGSFASTLTGGAGKDTFNVGAATSTASGSGVVLTSITDLAAGDKLAFAHAADTFATTAVNVSTATTLQSALDLAAAGAGGSVNWFTYGGNTYVVEDNGAGATFGNGDIVIKLNGTVDLSHSAISGGIVTIA
jgi:S-layer protein